MRSIGLLLALVLIAMPTGLITSCGACGENVEVRQVAPPLANASPREVVRTYFEALAGHDKETGRLMWDHRSPQYEAAFSAPDGGFVNWVSVTDVQVGEPEVEECGDIQRCVRVPVSYTFEQCEFYTGDDGPHSEGFFLDRIEGRWLINGHGQG
jgi:hypothetical protein